MKLVPRLVSTLPAHDPRSANRLLLVGLSFVSTTLCALPFSIQPNGRLPTTYPSTASYLITKNTAVAPNGNMIKWLPSNVSIAASGTTCATSLNTPFTLAKGSQCILNLTVSGLVNKNDSNPERHLMVCLSDRATCAGPDPDSSLNVTSYEAPSPTLLTAVGDYNMLGSNQSPLAYYSSDFGQTWAQSTISDGTVTDSMRGVACGNAGLNCTAVAANAVERGRSFSSLDGGKTWSSNGLMLATSSPSIFGIACDSAGTTCSAVGNYNTSGQATNPLIYYSTGNLSSWTKVVPMSVNISQIQSLVSVACSSTGVNCTAVGYYTPSAENKPSTYYTTNGGVSWTGVLPGGGLSVGNDAVLNGIACDSTGFSCIAVGRYAADSNTTTPIVPLIYLTSNGGATWGAPQHSLPLPVDSFSPSRAVLNSITCDSTGENCTAVGTYKTTASSNPKQPLTYYTLNGGQTWALSLPTPIASNTTLDMTGVAS